MIDDLDYDYDGNRLVNVTDAKAKYFRETFIEIRLLRNFLIMSFSRKYKDVVFRNFVNQPMFLVNPTRPIS